MVELVWREPHDGEGWGILANSTFQLATLKADLDENAAWDRTMRDLVQRQLPYTEFTATRQEALSARGWRRKLDQANLRYRFGFKGRSARLVRIEVKAVLAEIF